MRYTGKNMAKHKIKKSVLGKLIVQMNEMQD
jgi:hypothetical protein